MFVGIIQETMILRMNLNEFELCITSWMRSSKVAF